MKTHNITTSRASSADFISRASKTDCRMSVLPSWHNRRTRGARSTRLALPLAICFSITAVTLQCYVHYFLHTQPVTVMGDICSNQVKSACTRDELPAHRHFTNITADMIHTDILSYTEPVKEEKLNEMKSKTWQQITYQLLCTNLQKIRFTGTFISFVNERIMEEEKQYMAYVTKHAESLTNDVFRHGHYEWPPERSHQMPMIQDTTNHRWLWQEEPSKNWQEESLEHKCSDIKIH